MLIAPRAASSAGASRYSSTARWGRITHSHGFLYPVNYGYLPGVPAPDGEDLDAYVLGVDQPLERFEGICIAVIHRLDDADDKLVVVPPGGMSDSFGTDELSGAIFYRTMPTRSLRKAGCFCIRTIRTAVLAQSIGHSQLRSVWRCITNITSTPSQGTRNVVRACEHSYALA